MKKTTIVPAGEVRRSVRDGQYVTHIPLQFRRRGARKVLIPPPGEDVMTLRKYSDPPLLMALGRAFYWARLLEEGDYADAKALAKGVRIHVVTVKRMLRLTMIAPDIVQAIFGGTQPRTLTLEKIQRCVPWDWEEQRRLWGFGLDVTR